MFAAHVQTTRRIIARKINPVKIYFAKEELVANIFAGTHRSSASFECPLQHFAVASYDEILPRVEHSPTEKGSFVVRASVVGQNSSESSGADDGTVSEM